VSQSFVGNVLLRLDLMQKAAPNDGSYSKLLLGQSLGPRKTGYHPTVLGAYEKIAARCWYARRISRSRIAFARRLQGRNRKILAAQ